VKVSHGVPADQSISARLRQCGKDIKEAVLESVERERRLANSDDPTGTCVGHVHLIYKSGVEL